MVIKTGNFPIAGTDYYPDHATPPINGELVLAREPKNAYDTNAVSVWWSGTKLGYIPRPMAVLLAPMLDNSSFTVDARYAGQNMMFLKVNS